VAEIVNLRRVKKWLAREDASQAAAAGRARSGRTKHERDAEARAQDVREGVLDGARLERSGGNGESGE